MRIVRDRTTVRDDHNNSRIQLDKEGDGSMKKQASRVALTAIAMAAAVEQIKSVTPESPPI